MKKRDREDAVDEMKGGRAAREDTVDEMKGERAARDGEVDELLSAYAVGGLTPGEAARVEAYLSRHPEARDELDEIARTLAAVRAAEPRPHGEPDWDAMARDIQRVCSDEPAAPRWWQFWRQWWRRPVVLAAAGAVAVALVVVAVSRGDDATPDQERTAAVDPRGRAAPAEGATGDSATRRQRDRRPRGRR